MHAAGDEFYVGQDRLQGNTATSGTSPNLIVVALGVLEYNYFELYFPRCRGRLCSTVGAGGGSSRRNDDQTFRR